MELITSFAIGYLLGEFSPAAILSKRKHINMKQEGTKNLGASNTMLLLGKSYGALVMVIDIFKSYLAGKIARWLFPHLVAAGFVACLGAVIGHIFPFYLNFQGGKGLACFGGMVLFFNPWLLVFYLTAGVGLMILANRTVFLPVFASITFPVIVLAESGDPALFALSAITAAVILYAHRNNFGRVERGEEVPLRELIKTKVFKH